MMSWHCEDAAIVHSELPYVRSKWHEIVKRYKATYDGYFDDWEIFLGTNPEDLNDYPFDNDNDKIPDGDSNNSESWMDNDDDNDGLSDNWELEFNFNPLNSADANINLRLTGFAPGTTSGTSVSG